MAGVSAVYDESESEIVEYEFMALAPPTDFAVTKKGFATWETPGGPQELLFITQNPGDPSSGYYQEYGNGYGVVYDLSAYPDALANSIEFHHCKRLRLLIVCGR